MEPLNVQPQTLPLDLSAYGFTPPLLSLPVIHPALLSSIVDMQNANSKYLSIDPGESGKFNQPESNNNETAPPQVSSSRSDSDSTVSPAAPRHNVIVKNHSKRKKELVKDSAYWERRRKNNDAAKKSRDSRRQKEDDMACRAATLEQENIKLRAELEQLKNETGHLRALMLHAPVKVPLSLHHPIGSTSLHTNISMIAAPSVITTTDFCGSLPHLPFSTGPPRNTVLVNNLKT
ncbi:unnamed protein product [Cylicocyclus nassatus]|uniref:BZIP domain-containing protein n=1 Tax=Cylicocyclus nassatus TaxID=53992 RepID=A0AA36GGZ1_CYLNA|nr:unnamed protein product [Cylicocyclus nassatus]